MTLEQLVPDLATSQELRDKGLPQGTALVWFFRSDALNHYSWVSARGETIDDDNHVAAPTVGELEEWLMEKGYKFRCAKNLFGAYAIVASRLDEDENNKEHRPYDGYNEKHVAALAQLCLEVAG